MSGHADATNAWSTVSTLSSYPTELKGETTQHDDRIGEEADHIDFADPILHDAACLLIRL